MSTVICELHQSPILGVSEMLALPIFPYGPDPGLCPYCARDVLYSEIARITMPRSKYGAIPTVIDNIRFASKKESQCYANLKLLQKAGKISGLELQPSFEINVNGILICKYVADFRYIENGREVIADAKGFRTREYKYKKLLMRAVHGIDVKEL